MGDNAVMGKVQPLPNDPDWARLLDAERSLESEIAAAQADAQERLARARAAAAAALPDPAALAALADAQELADRERQRRELARIAEQADATVGALIEAPDALIDALAQLALDAVLTDQLAAAHR